MKIRNDTLVRQCRTKTRCEVCGGNVGLQVHHEPTWGSASLEIRLTLIRLCLPCHNQRHNGAAFRKAQEIIEAICRREKCDQFDREDVVMLLKRAPKEASTEWLMGEASEWPESAVGLLLKTLAGVTR